MPLPPASVSAPSGSAGSDMRLRGKRVAMVTFSCYPADPRPRRAIDALLESGMEVDLICLKDSGEPARETKPGLRILRLPISHRRQGKFSYAFNYSAFLLACTLLHALRTPARRYDLVHVHNMPDFLVLCSLIPKLFGAKVILDMHDPMPELMTTIYNCSPDARAVRLLRRIEKASMAWADLVITVNLACKRIFSKRSCRAEKIGIVMNSPDEKIFPFRPASRSIPRVEEPSRFRIMYHGSLVERNGLRLAVQALPRLRQLVPGAELRIYGQTTPFLESVLQEAAAKGLSGCVHYLGRRSLHGLVDEIEACDLGIIPNERSAFAEINTPTRIFEYLALGKPVIAPRTTGIRDYFDDQSLLFFEPGDAEDLAHQAARAFAHPAETAEIARRGQEVQQAHRWTKERRTFLDLVTQALETPAFRPVALRESGRMPSVAGVRPEIACEDSEPAR